MEIKLDQIRKKYRETLVLDIDELLIKKGEITGITGSNGAGKTTMLHIVAGLDLQYEGRVTYDGRQLDRDIIERMTLVFQKPYLFRRSVFDNIAYPLQIREWTREKIKERVAETAVMIGIDDLLTKKGHQLSGGESQKVSLARAIAIQPQLLLLDEPTSNLDPESVIRMEEAIKSYSEEHKATVLMITHNMEQAERICQNQIRLELGRMK